MHKYSACLVIFILVLLSGCNVKTAQIWTDRPEFALYGEYFNVVQKKYKVSVKYAAFPVKEVGRGNCPDLIAASWLKNSSTGNIFKNINNLFGAKGLSRATFYQRILAAGRIDRTQYLVPVSFNIPALVFSREKEELMSNHYTIDFDEVQILSKSFNKMNRDVYTHMGFSPLWNDDFLLIWSMLSGTSFMEANPLSWDDAALERSMVFINNWTNEINTSNHAEDDFTFKYFYEPPDRLIQSGRILFSYMESKDFFILDEERKNNIDFRWIVDQNRIPVTDDTVYMGIPKRAISTRAAKAFIQWFFDIENQRTLLEYSTINRIDENIFGICGGFSALSPVTEQIYPLFYPELLGRMPPPEYFLVSNVLPGNWVILRERIILPYLHERARKSDASETYPLERRMADWTRVNR